MDLTALHNRSPQDLGAVSMGLPGGDPGVDSMDLGGGSSAGLRVCPESKPPSAFCSSETGANPK